MTYKKANARILNLGKMFVGTMRNDSFGTDAQSCY